MKLVFFSGPSATGKTSIGKEMAKRLHEEFHSKDTIKEALFDSESHSTHDFRWYDNKAKAIFFGDIKQLIEGKQSFIMESNFTRSDRRNLTKLLPKDATIAEVYCEARGYTELRRFVRRNENGDRHRGHHDRKWYLSIWFENTLAIFGIEWPYKPLKFSTHLLRVDTTDFSKVDYDAIERFIKES